jgi:hypothetical protein
MAVVYFLLIEHVYRKKYGYDASGYNTAKIAPIWDFQVAFPWGPVHRK